MKYQNPILAGYYPDPSICKAGEYYYLVNSSFEYFPGVPIFKSKDLVNWDQVGHCLTRKSQLDLSHSKSSGGIYAPTIRYHEGVFYMVTTDTTGILNFYVTSTDPEKGWSEPILVKQGGIDPDLFFDDDGKVYFSSNGLHWAETPGNYISEIDIKTGKLLSKPTFMWGGTGGKFPEAPHIYKRNGYYYLLIAEGGTEFGHSITIARSKEIMGPYLGYEKNPILCHSGSWSGIQSTGHGDLIEDENGHWWIVFLGVRHMSYPLVHHLGRETYLAPVDWNEDGWPVINDNKLVSLKMEVSGRPEVTQVRKTSFEDNFTTNNLKLDWNFRRNPIPESYRCGNGLELKCVAANLDDVTPVSFLGKRQCHFECKIEVEMTFNPLNSEEAGISIIMNEKHRCDFFLQKGEFFNELCVRRVMDSIHYISNRQDFDGNKLTLIVEATEQAYTYKARVGGSDITLGSSETRHLSTEMSGGFTGVYLGLYATANGLNSENFAQFNNFQYTTSDSAVEWDRDIKSVTQKPKKS